MARDQPEGNRISDIRSNDWDGGCRLFHRNRQLSIAGDHNIRLETNHLVRERRPARQIAIGISICNVDVATRDIAEFLHAPYKRSYDRCRRCRRLPIFTKATSGRLVETWAMTPSGQAVAPPNSVMNSRRLMGSLPDPSSKLRLPQEACVVRHSKIGRPTSGVGQSR